MAFYEIKRGTKQWFQRINELVNLDFSTLFGPKSTMAEIDAWGAGIDPDYTYVATSGQRHVVDITVSGIQAFEAFGTATVFLTGTGTSTLAVDAAVLAAQDVDWEITALAGVGNLTINDPDGNAMIVVESGHTARLLYTAETGFVYAVNLNNGTHDTFEVV